MSQSNTQLSGGLGTIQSVGNLWRIRLDDDKQTGTWKIQMASAQPYTLKVTGQTEETLGSSGRGHPYVPRVLCSLFFPKRVLCSPVAIHIGEHRTLFGKSREHRTLLKKKGSYVPQSHTKRGT